MLEYISFIVVLTLLTLFLISLFLEITNTCCYNRRLAKVIWISLNFAFLLLFIFILPLVALGVICTIFIYGLAFMLVRVATKIKSKFVNPDY